MQNPAKFRGEKYIQDVFRSVNVFLLLITGAGDIQFASQQIIERLGFNEEDLKKKSIFDLHPQKYHAEIRELLNPENNLLQKSIRLPLICQSGKILEVTLEINQSFLDEQPVLFAFYQGFIGQSGTDLFGLEKQDMAAALADIGVVLNSSLDIDQVLDHVLTGLGKIVRGGTINLIRIEGKEGRVIRCCGYSELGTEEMMRSRRYEIKKVKTFAKIVNTKQPLVIRDTKTNADWPNMPESNWVRSFLGIPIVIKGSVYGLLNCESGTPGFFTEKDIFRLSMFANHAAIAIENALLFAETTRRLNQITGINDIAQEMIRAEKVEDIYREIPTRLLKIFNASTILLTKWNPDKKIVERFISAGDNISPKMPKSSQPGQKTITEIVLLKRQPIIINDKKKFPDWDAQFKNAILDPSLLVLPLIVADQPKGAILFGFRDIQQITGADTSIAEYACNQLASFIQRIEGFELINKHNDQLAYANNIISSLTKVAISIKNALDPKQAMAIMGEGLQAINIGSLVLLVEPITRCLKLEYINNQDELSRMMEKWGMHIDFPLLLPPPIFNALYDELNDLEPVLIDEPIKLLKKVLPVALRPFVSIIQEKLTFSSKSKILFIPLIGEQKVIGWLGLISQTIQNLDRQAAEIFSSQISSALENSKLVAKVQLLAVTDELTGINNRRGLFLAGNREFNISKRLGKSLFALMIDLDDFKEINDNYGHAVGDQALIELARRLERAVREIDIIGRYGGEEFVVLLVESDLASANLIAERLRSEINRDPIVTSKGLINIAASIGIAELTDQTTGLEELIENADKALYKAKRQGKNQVVEF